MNDNTLYSPEGKIYTNGVSFGKVVYLADDVSPEGWYEITKAEYEEILNKELSSDD